MADDRSALFSKLNTVAFKAIQAAALTCKMRGNPYLDLGHMFEALISAAGSGNADANDLLVAVRAFDLDATRLVTDLTTYLDRLQRGGGSAALSVTFQDAVERGWLFASLRHDRSKLRTGDILLAMLNDGRLRPQLFALSAEFKKLKRDDFESRFDEILSDSDEAAASAAGRQGGGVVPGEESGAVAPASMGKQEALDRFTQDLTRQARDGEIDPVVGREAEVRQLVDVLMRRRQNNPILIGEAGVGKTAVVEGFANRIAFGDVPPSMKDVRLLSLDVGLLKAARA